jgi:hypothetical protein
MPEKIFFMQQGVSVMCIIYYPAASIALQPLQSLLRFFHLNDPRVSIFLEVKGC